MNGGSKCGIGNYVECTVRIDGDGWTVARSVRFAGRVCLIESTVGLYDELVTR